MKKILVGDDDLFILAVVEKKLSSPGFEVLTDATGFNIDAIVKSYK